MLIKEFIDRTGFTPTDDYYHTEIEPEYNRSKLEKDDWCREWKKNGGIQKAYDAMCKDAANNHLRVKELESVIDENTQKLAEYYKRIQELENLGLTEKQALELMDGTGCWWGKGFAPFQLTNNNAKIRDTQARIDRLTNMVNTEDRTEEYEWGSIEYCYSEERLRLHFNEIPDEKLRSELKGSAFKWSRLNQAWQRQLTDNAIYAAKRILNIK